MTIELIRDVRVAGVVQVAGAQLTLSVSEEAAFVSSNVAVFVTRDPSLQNLAISAVVRDTAGRVTSYTDNGVPVTVTYDGAGRVATITRAAVVSTITYDASGNVSQIIEGLP